MREVSLIIFAVGAALCGCRQGSGEQNVSVVDSAIAVGDSVIITEVDSAVVDSVVTEPEPVEVEEKVVELMIIDDRPAFAHYELETLDAENELLERKIQNARQRMKQLGIDEAPIETTNDKNR